jgi:Uma2 family endonuclease
MSILLDQPALRERVHRVSPEHYHRMGELGLVNEKHELIYGYVIDKMSKSPNHEWISQKLMMMLIKAVADTLTVRPERPLSIGDSEPEPDISVVKGKASDWRNNHPATAELVIEVAITSVDLDLEKANIYASAAIPEYWIVRPADEEIDIFREPVAGRYGKKETVRGNDEIRCGSVANFFVVPAVLFAEE